MLMSAGYQNVDFPINKDLLFRFGVFQVVPKHYKNVFRKFDRNHQARRAIVFADYRQGQGKGCVNRVRVCPSVCLSDVHSICTMLILVPARFILKSVIFDFCVHISSAKFKKRVGVFCEAQSAQCGFLKTSYTQQPFGPPCPEITGSGFFPTKFSIC